jgi:hypothetical protein
MVPVLESHDVTVALKYGVALSGLFGRAGGPRNFMKNGQSGKMGLRRGEVGKAVAKLRPSVCLIRSMRALSE